MWRAPPPQPPSPPPQQQSYSKANGATGAVSNTRGALDESEDSHTPTDELRFAYVTHVLDVVRDEHVL
ncbi:hypothetical protein EYF80_012454 [Liparis tanakae]|uniref:Uncharacterized protein n=1 Tax=Liparis tanakae TaxID=230148 RepID=A0A4Z2IHA7_9TELE|nr:hypothetical protein EYF80_012454 [Liparis tanakae]